MQFMRQTKRLLGIIAVVAVIGFMAFPLTGCSQDDGDKLARENDNDIEDTRIKVKLIEIVADGSDWTKTTQLTLTFTDEIPDLSADDISFSGVTGVEKGELSDPETANTFVAYTLPISGFTVTGTLNINVTKQGYNVIIESEPVTVFYDFRPDLDMVSISAGTFVMGSPTNEAGRQYNETQHYVTLSGFRINKYQVTQEQYQVVMGSNPSQFKSAVAGESGTPDKLPVEMVSWYNAIVFCNKLSVMAGLDPVYSINSSTDPADWGNTPNNTNATWDAVVMDMSKNGYRLPTEAEWEYACRAGTTTIYNTGDTISNNTGWYISNSNINNSNSVGTHHVGLKPANAWGLYDMHGNVLEWVWDWSGWTYYSDSLSIVPNKDPSGPSSGDFRVRRGGSCGDQAQNLRSAFRGQNYPYSASNGFRLARSVN